MKLLLGSSTLVILLRHLFHHLIQVEAGWLLARWKLLEAGQPLSDKGLGRRKQEDAVDPPVRIVDRFHLCSLERIGVEVEQLGNAQLNKRRLPHRKPVSGLLEEHGLPLVVTQRGEFAVICPIKKLATRPSLRLALQRWH